MNYRQAQEWSEAYIMGDLAPTLADQLEAHLKQCDACWRRYEEQKRLIALLRRMFAVQRRFL